MSFTQVARELPSLTISVQQFALAISNNLPMVQDEIRKAKAEIAALRAEGKETPTLLQRIGSSIISWNVGLSVGIALLTAFSGKIVEFVSGLFDSEVATRKAKEAQRQLNEILDEGIEIRDQYNSTLKVDYGTETRNLENQLAYARARGAADIDLLKIEKQIADQRRDIATEDFFALEDKGLDERKKQLKEAEDAYKAYADKIGYIIQNGQRNVFGIDNNDISTDQKNELKALKKDFDEKAKLFERDNKIVEEYHNSNRDAEVKALELQKALKDQRAKFFGDELQYRADILKNFSQIEETQEITRVNSRKEALRLESKIIEGQYADELIEAKNNEVKIFEVHREFAFKRKKLQEDYERDILSIHQTAIKQRRAEEERDNDQFIQDQEEALNKQIDHLQMVQDKRQLARVEGQEAEIKALNKRYEKQIAATKEGSREREKVEREYAERRADIEYSYALAELKNQIEFAEKIIAVRKAAGLDVTKEEETLHKLRMQLSDIETNRVIENNKRSTKDQIERFEKIKRGIDTIRSVYKETTAFIDGLLSASIDKQKNKIAEQIDEIEKQKEKEIEAINATSQSQQDKAAAVALVEAKAAAQREALERKQRQLDQQRARFEKMITIGRIIGDTAAAVVAALGAKPWTPANIAQAIAVGAIGAGQLAVAVATPIPKFKHGREKGPATLGVVGDGGVSEVVTSPDLSKAFVTPATDTLTYLPKDWKVFPDVDAFQAAAMGMVHKPLPAMPILQNNNNDGLIHAMAYSIGRLERAVMNKQETHFHWDNGELMKAIKNGHDTWRYIQRNV
jgi:hypothetical protein